MDLLSFDPLPSCCNEATLWGERRGRGRGQREGERERGRCELAFCQTHSSSVRDSASARIISKNTTQICMGDDVDVEEYMEVKPDFASPLNDPSDRYCYEQKVICRSEGYTESFP